MLFRQIYCKSLRIKNSNYLHTINYTNLNKSAILISEVPDSMAAAPELNQFMLEFDFREALRNDFIRNSFVGY